MMSNSVTLVRRKRANDFAIELANEIIQKRIHTCERQIEAVNAAVETVKLEIETLSDKVSYLQVRSWRIHRRHLNARKAFLKSKIKSLQNLLP